MLRLIIDTSHKYLLVALTENDKLLAYKQEIVSKKQSEYLIPFVNDVFSMTNYNKNDIEEIIVTDGPGSYTGMRIGLTFVKSIAMLNPEIKVYTINTLLSLSGKENGFSFIDARSKRVFGAFVKNGFIEHERIYQVDEIKDLDENLFGDLEILKLEEKEINIAENILDLEDNWVLCNDVDTLVPRYLK